MELQNIRRIAVFKMRNIGDVLMITPALRALREAFPGAKITVVVNPGTEAMLAHNPDVDDLLIYPRDAAKEGHPFARLGAELRFLRELRRHQPDLSVSLTEGDRAAWSSRLSGARYRAGMGRYRRGVYDPRSRFYNLPTPPLSNDVHEVEKQFLLLQEAGLVAREKKPGPLCLVVPDDLRRWAREQLDAKRPVVHVHPVSRWLWKCWTNEAMAEVIDWLQAERDAQVVVTTGPADRERERAREIVALCRRAPVFHDGNLSLGQIAALSAEADLFFGVDTAPMHIAAAVGTPVIALFGPTRIVSWAPWCEQKQVLSQPCACNITRKVACDWDKVRACLAAITPDEAKAACDRMLFRREAPVTP